LVWLDSPRAIEDHLRRDIPPHDLDEPGVRFIVCDEDNQVLMHAQVGGHQEGDEPDPPDGLGVGPDATITRFIAQFGVHGMLDSVLVALTRPGRAAITADDRACYRAARTVCAAQDVRLLGVHVVTPRGQRVVVLDEPPWCRLADAG
jgi:hypothetical protein